MNATTQLREQLETLSIPKDQRPAARRGSAGAGRWLVRLLLIGAVCAAAYFGYAQRDRLMVLVASVSAGASQTKSPELRLITATARREADLPPVHTGTGRIVSDHRVAVSTKVSGQIVALYFEQGDRVSEGQQLARIEDVIFRARRDEAAANLARAEAMRDYSEYNHARISELQRMERASEIEMQEATRSRREAIAAVDAARAALAFAEKQLRDTVVLAPISGVVLERNVEVGDFVAAEGGRGANANAQFASVADMTKLRVEVDVSELDIARLRPGMFCEITPDAYKDRTYTGHVMWIDPGANFAKATVQVKVRIDNPDDFLRVEGQAQVEFLPEKPGEDAQKEAVWLPRTAIRSEGDPARGIVFMARGGVLRETPVTLGRTSGAMVEVTEGLRGGESVVADGLDGLRDGQAAGR